MPNRFRRSTVQALLLGILLLGASSLPGGAVMAQAQPAQSGPPTFVVYFPRGSVHLGPKAIETVARAAAAVTQAKAQGTFSHVKAIGYSNVAQELADRRALLVRNALVKAGVPRADIHVEGRAKLHPGAPGAPPVDHPRNRRVRIVIYRPGD